MIIIRKIIVVFIATLCIITIMPTNISKAANTSKLNEIILNMGNSEAPSNTNAIKRLKRMVKRFLGAIRTLTGLALIVMLAYTGFKIVVEDTPKGKDSIKKAMFPLVIGTLIVFSATTIASFIIKIFE